jgi:hypothetical protein
MEKPDHNPCSFHFWRGEPCDCTETEFRVESVSGTYPKGLIDLTRLEHKDALSIEPGRKHK